MRTWSSPDLPRLPGSGGPVRVLDSRSGTQISLGGHDEVRLYVCGITPYDATHLGHAATYLTFDLLNRALRDQGASVRYVQNVTDVDEPLLERAQRDGVDWRELAVEQTDLYRSDMEALRILAPDALVGAVESVPGDVRAVRELLASGAAYRVPVPDGEGHDVYLDVTAVPGFGHVSGLSHGEMMVLFAERGGDPERAGKRHPLDPLLWRAERSGEPAWDGGPLGPGRPGWHIECTSIARDSLGLPLTVQGGGSDLAFPHHEMSAAQARALGADDFASLYVHQAMVGLNGSKMSKSLGNLVLVSRLRAGGADPMAVRLALLSQHHSRDWEWQASLLTDATDRLESWRAACQRGRGAGDAVVLQAVRDALADDLDSPRALVAVDDVARTHGIGPDGAGVLDALLGVSLASAFSYDEAGGSSRSSESCVLR